MTTARASLRLLDLTGCYRITVQGLVTMLSNLTALTAYAARNALELSYFTFHQSILEMLDNGNKFLIFLVFP
jgi:hypothetical protein